MSNNTENNHIYYVDPGIGTKSPSCPYTHHEDGRDVFSYVYPPKGYELIGFKLEPYESDKFYDGKIVAQYEKKTFSDKLSENLWMYILAAIAFIGVLAVLAFYVFDFPRKPSPTQQAKPSASSFIVDTPVQEQVSDTPINSENTLIVEDVKENVIDETPETEEVAVEEVAKEETTEPVKEEIAQEEATPIEKTAEPQEKAIVEKSEPEPVATQEEQPTEVLTKEQFHEEFWDLIHNKESHMRTYGNLYRKYKSLNLKTREFYYLYLTILENTTAFSSWKDKLLNIPSDELKSIQSISALNEKLEEYE
jgi:hypothetical protein